ncbi:MAG: hypothetical protein WC107_03805 [Patescibacteria group bacterium]
MKLNFNKPNLSIPKMKLVKLDISKINLRKLNGMTILAVLSYLSILVIIPVLFGRKSSYIRFHARQGIALLFLWVIFSFSFYLPFIPWVLAVIIIASIIYGIVNAVTGKERILPLVGKYAK